jgi:hydrogenase expression/formation protein HypC
MCLGLPGEVVSLIDKAGLPFARIRFGGVTHEACMVYLPTAAVGDFVLVHVGFAISKLDPEEAARAWAVLTDLGEVAEPHFGEPPLGEGGGP